MKYKRKQEKDKAMKTGKEKPVKEGGRRIQNRKM